MTVHPERYFRWTWNLLSPPELLWPLVSNTDRFNRDCGYPPVTVLPPAAGANRVTNVRRLRVRVMGLVIEWEERPFEWIAPRCFGVERNYASGPVARMVVSCELQPCAGGTIVVYELRLTPATWLGRLALPYAIGRRAQAVTGRVFRRYDELARGGLRVSREAQRPKLVPGGAARLAAIGRELVAAGGQPEPRVRQLCEFVASADELSVGRIRPYVLADEWRANRRDTLRLFLHATRAGLLDFSWDVLCPHCRGAQPGQRSLVGVASRGHCQTCDVDFTANFDQSIELTFIPNAGIRAVTRVDYCVGGPQITPHVVAQQALGPGERRVLPLALAPGRYRVRWTGGGSARRFRVEAGAPATLAIDSGANRPEESEPTIAPTGELALVNAAPGDCRAVVEHLAWSDQSATAAEVTSLQAFRDLFAREVLRPGEQISVGALTVVFTDLKNSTQLYQEIGDAPAFGRVLTHFGILKAAVAAEEGAIVKTMGDAILAVFTRPVAALRAMQRAQRHLACPQDFPLPAGVAVPSSSLQPLALKAGLHCGPCLAINQNDRLDYFGTTVNTTARLCSLCTGGDLVLSAAVRGDPEIAALLAAPDFAYAVAPEETRLKGFGQATFQIWRLTRR